MSAGSKSRSRAHDYRSYHAGQRPSAACRSPPGENHFTRFEFTRLIEEGAITILQPDLSKTGGITEMPAHRGDGLGLQAADPSAHLDDRAQHGR